MLGKGQTANAYLIYWNSLDKVKNLLVLCNIYDFKYGFWLGISLKGMGVFEIDVIAKTKWSLCTSNLNCKFQ